MTLLLPLILFAVPTLTSSLSCLDENGKPVDWFAIYKLPKVPSEDKNLAAGLSYMYLDVNHPSYSYSSSKNVEDPKSSFFHTLEQVYGNRDSQDMGYGFYNDELPKGKTSSYRGHTKGAFAFNNQQGFWMIHSVPHFPNSIQEGFQYPSSGTTYGQSMLCISLNYLQFDIVGQHFLYTYPQYYNVSISQNIFGEDLPNLISAAVDENHVKAAPFSNTFTIKSRGGMEFLLFSKYKTASFDIVSSMMAPHLQNNLFSETWQNGGGDLPSNCTGKFDTETVAEIEFNQDKFSINFTTNKDHSKWAVGVNSSSTYWVCIGDLNRQCSQQTRSGGYACWQHKSVHDQYVQLVHDVQPCI